MKISDVFSSIAERTRKTDLLKNFLPKEAGTLSTVERDYLAKKAPNFAKLVSGV